VTLPVPGKKPGPDKLSYEPKPARLRAGRQGPTVLEAKPAVKPVNPTAVPADKITSAQSKTDYTEKRKSGGGDAGDLSEVNRKKVRGAVYEALIREKFSEKDELFRPCFTKLFNICKMYVMEAQAANPNSCTKKWMLEIAVMNVKAVVGMERMMKRRKK